MVVLRWLQRLGPPIAALGAAALLVSASGGVTAGAAGAPPCDASSAGTLAAARAVEPATAASVAAETWFTLDPRLDGAGALAGQRLQFGRRNARPQTLELPAESFVAGPFGGTILVGADDGSTSTIRAISGSAECTSLVAAVADVVRTATIDPRAGNVYEFRVERATRADLGVWRRPLAGGPATRVLEPLPADGRFGPTFSTTLSWSEEGEDLVIQSCAMTSCRTRFLEVASGRVRTVGAADQGELIGAVAGRLIAYAACRGLPCPILSIDAVTGDSRKLVEAAGLARLVPTDDGAAVIHEIVAGEAVALAAVDPTTGDRRPVGGAVPGLRLVPDARRSLGGIRLPRGWALLTPDGRPAAGERSILIRVSDGATVALPEVVP